MQQTGHALDNLPLPLNRFIGRTAEISALKQRVWSTRLLTLTGPGGCGKTRLALKVAEELRDVFADGVWLVELAPLSDPALVLQTVSAALDVHEHAAYPLLHTLIDFLRPRELLLVLDNCEHLIEACALLTQDMLQACPDVRILATSREALNVAGESAWLVPSLSIENPQRIRTKSDLLHHEAAQLFLDRASLAQAAFEVTDASAPAIAQICYQLDGMPLAIELAAARVRVLAVEQIADRLDDRFNLLNAGSRAAPARHQTLRAMIDWSYGLLEPQEKTLFRRLAIFSGGWTLEAAETVCAADEINATEVLSVLSQLVDKSLASVDRLIGQARYSFPETIRQYAREKLLESGEFQAVQDRHLDYFLQLAEKAESHLIGAEQVIWLKHLEREHDNLRTALECSLGEGHVEKGLRLAAALSQFWQMRGYLREGRARLEALLSRSSETSASRRASALLGAGFLSSYQDDVEQATASYEKALALYRDLDDKSGIAYSLVWLGWMAETQGDYTQARTFAKQSLTLYRELDSKWGVAMALFCLAEVAYLQGDFEQATALLRESLALCREIGNAWAAGRRLTRLGQVTHALGDPEHAIDLIRDGLNVCRQASDYTGIGWALAGLAGVAGAQGEVVWAVRLMGSVAAFWEETGAALWSLDRREYECNVAIARTQLDETTFATAWTEGQAMTLEETIAYALAERQISLPIKHSTPTTSSRTDKQRTGGLTAREREVAALIAQGKSNRDIAEALVLSERTIEGHVSNILNKLGFTARTQIAAWAVEKGLAKAG